MSDLIKREDAIRAIDEAFSDIPIEQTAEILKVRRTIRTIPSADRPQGWIPCSEGLPIEYRTVFVTWEYKGKPYTTTAFRETKNAVTCWASNEQPNYTPLNVVAWMPLPKPWEGADNDD